MMKLIFCQQINAKVFCKLIISLWVCRARDAQSIQNNKLTNLEINLLNEFAKTKRLSILRNILKTNLNELNVSLEPVKMKFI